MLYFCVIYCICIFHLCCTIYSLFKIYVQLLHIAHLAPVWVFQVLCGMVKYPCCSNIGAQYQIAGDFSLKLSSFFFHSLFTFYTRLSVLPGACACAFMPNISFSHFKTYYLCGPVQPLPARNVFLQSISSTDFVFIAPSVYIGTSRTVLLVLLHFLLSYSNVFVYLYCEFNVPSSRMLYRQAAIFGSAAARLAFSLYGRALPTHIFTVILFSVF